MRTVSKFCSQCRQYARILVSDGQDLVCPHCSNIWGKVDKEEHVLERCPVCSCRQFYVDKDFNQVLGFVILGIGILLVPKTYGLSLPFFALLYWLIYRRIPQLVACYRCGSEYRGFTVPKHLKPFLHPIGLKYDRYR